MVSLVMGLLYRALQQFRDQENQTLPGLMRFTIASATSAIRTQPHQP